MGDEPVKIQPSPPPPEPQTFSVPQKQFDPKQHTLVLFTEDEIKEFLRPQFVAEEKLVLSARKELDGLFALVETEFGKPTSDDFKLALVERVERYASIRAFNAKEIARSFSIGQDKKAWQKKMKAKVKSSARSARTDVLKENGITPNV